MAVNNVVNKMKEFMGWDATMDPDGYDNFDGNGLPVSHVEDNSIHSMTTMQPRNFNDARAIGEVYRSGMTTVVNLSSLSDADGRRIVDFMSGLVLALNGQIERIDSKVFILTPETINVVTDNATGSNPSTGFYNIG